MIAILGVTLIFMFMDDPKKGSTVQEEDNPFGNPRINVGKYGLSLIIPNGWKKLTEQDIKTSHDPILFKTFSKNNDIIIVTKDFNKDPNNIKYGVKKIMINSSQHSYYEEFFSDKEQFSKHINFILGNTSSTSQFVINRKLSVIDPPARSHLGYGAKREKLLRWESKDSSVKVVEVQVVFPKKDVRIALTGYFFEKDRQSFETAFNAIIETLRHQPPPS